MIFLSGERAPFIKTLIGLVMIFLIVNIKWRTKFLYLLLSIVVIFSIISTNPIIFDRHVKQLKYHLFSNDESSNNQIIFMRYYYPMFQTSIKMFQDSKILGKGPKTYRYHCNDPKFITFYPTDRTINNTVLKINIPWKQKGNLYQ